MIEVSCPARVDIGNTLDIPSYFFSMPLGTAHTVNIAIGLRTKVSYSPSRNSYIEIMSDGIVERNVESFDRNMKGSRFPMIWGVLKHFKIKTGIFQIESDIPKGSGLGGSAALMVSLISTVLKLKGLEVSKQIRDKVLLFCHLFENWLGFSSTGFHDQLAAIWGGANLWTWGVDFQQDGLVYQKYKLLSSKDSSLINERLILTFTGESHKATKMELHSKLLSEHELKPWYTISQLAKYFSSVLETKDWESAARFLNKECDICAEIAPNCISKRAGLLIKIARNEGVGSRHVGHGHGGCVWALGDKNKIANTFTEWKAQSDKWVGAWTIYPGMAEKGLVINEY